MCWKQIVQDTGLTSVSPPDCTAAYEREMKRTPQFANQVISDPTIVDYEAVVTLGPNGHTIAPATGKKVAVVGGGPAGLAAAAFSLFDIRLPPRAYAPSSSPLVFGGGALDGRSSPHAGRTTVKIVPCPTWLRTTIWPAWFFTMP